MVLKSPKGLVLFTGNNLVKEVAIISRVVSKQSTIML